MMTRSKKKRSIGQDRSSPQKANKEYSTIPANDAAEAGEMVPVDQGGTSVGLYQTPDHRQVAWLLREKLNELVDGDQGEFPESGLRSLLDMAAKQNIISVDPKMLNPVSWRTLPKELLVLVLARLPLRDITRLRSLSREWRRELATVNSDINRACDEASSTMVALLSRSSTDAFCVTTYDVTKSRWQYAYHLRLRRPVPWNNDWEPCPNTWSPVDACDGGLVCFISLWKPTVHNRFSIAVVNLLTRVQHELPPLKYKYNILPAMVQIKVDSHTKCYKVVVGVYRAGALRIETYDSGTGEWTRAVRPSGPVFGRNHAWTSWNGWCYNMLSSSPGAYDFGERKFRRCSEFQPAVTDWELINTAVEKDRVFDLHEQTQTDTSLGGRIRPSFHIREYRFDNRTKAWEKENSYECPGFEDGEVEELYSVRLNACDGFLMVIFHYNRRGTYFRLLDLSTGEWSNVPENPNSGGMHLGESVLCRTVWNVVP